MEKIKKVIENSLIELYNNDSILINRNTKEEAINHWLAIYIDKNIKIAYPKTLYNVDIEYNRNVTNDNEQRFFSKTIMYPKYIEKRDIVIYTKTEIIPDIIVHQRGSNNHNLLCIEAKKNYNYAKESNDIQKILGLLDIPYNYSYGCLVEYLPEEEIFAFLIIRKNNLDYQSERFFINKPIKN
ncbi:MAG: hypothetical protein ACOYO1_18515 [Bacteroidales bacterium]